MQTLTLKLLCKIHNMFNNNAICLYFSIGIYCIKHLLVFEPDNWNKSWCIFFVQILCLYTEITNFIFDKKNTFFWSSA